MFINLITAYCKNYGIGINNTLPFSFKSDLKFFSKITKGNNNQVNAVIMGRNTWNSLPFHLNNRINIVITKYPEKLNKIDIHTDIDNIEQPITFNNIQDAIDCCKINNISELWVIGGESIYKYFLDNNLINNMFITEIDHEYECDKFFPKYNKDNWKKQNEIECQEKNIKLYFKEYSYINDHNNQR